MNRADDQQVERHGGPGERAPAPPRPHRQPQPGGGEQGAVVLDLRIMPQRWSAFHKTAGRTTKIDTSTAAYGSHRRSHRRCMGDVSKNPGSASARKAAVSLLIIAMPNARPVTSQLTNVPQVSARQNDPRARIQKNPRGASG